VRRSSCSQARDELKGSGQGNSWAGSNSIASGIWRYPLTGDGRAIEMTAKGAKY